MDFEIQQYDGSSNMLGVISGEPNDVYHANPALSSTESKDIDNPPLFEKKHVTGEIEREPKKCYDIGTATHALLLEGEEAYRKQIAETDEVLTWRGASEKRNSIDIMSEFLIEPIDDIQKQLLSKKNKDEILDFFNRRRSRIILDAKERDQLMKMKESAMNSADFMSLISGGYSELVFRTETLSTGFGIQCKGDYVNFDKNYFFDLKTVDNLGKFWKDFENLKYYYSAAYYLKTSNYLTGNIFDTFYFGVIEKQEPFDCIVLEIVDDANFEMAKEEVNVDFNLLQRYTEQGHFPRASEQGITPIAVSDWVAKKIARKIQRFKNG